MPVIAERLTIDNLREHFAGREFPSEEARRQEIEATFWREMEADALGFLGQQKPLPPKKVMARIIGDNKNLSFETLAAAMTESWKVNFSHIIQTQDGKGNWVTVGGRDLDTSSPYDQQQIQPPPRRRRR